MAARKIAKDVYRPQSLEETAAAQKSADLADRLRGATPEKGEAIKVPPLKIIETNVRVRGVEPVITHRFSEKAIKEILDKKMGKAKPKREPCDPEREFNAAKYVDKGKDCLPTLAFKCAITDAASFVEGITKVLIRGAVFIKGEYVPIHCKDCSMRQDVVRVGMGSADIRFRPMYKDWYVDLPIQFNPNVITAEQLHHLIQLAGFSIGICEWRPQKDGQFGRFEIVPPHEYADKAAE